MEKHLIELLKNKVAYMLSLRDIEDKDLTIPLFPSDPNRSIYCKDKIDFIESFAKVLQVEDEIAEILERGYIRVEDLELKNRIKVPIRRLDVRDKDLSTLTLALFDKKVVRKIESTLDRILLVEELRNLIKVEVDIYTDFLFDSRNDVYDKDDSYLSTSPPITLNIKLDGNEASFVSRLTRKVVRKQIDKLVSNNVSHCTAYIGISTDSLLVPVEVDLREILDYLVPK